MNNPTKTGGWETRQLGEVCTFLKTAAFPRNKTEDYDGGIGYIHYGDIHKLNKPYFDFSKEQLKQVVKSLDTSKFDFLQDGDIVIVDASEDYTGVGANFEIKSIGDKKVIAGLHTFALRPDPQYILRGFLTYLLRDHKTLKKLKRAATGASVIGISKRSLSEIQISFPSLSEQEKIVSTLNVWDRATETIEKLVFAKEKKLNWLMDYLICPTDKKISKVHLGDIATIKKGERLNRNTLSMVGEYPVWNGGSAPSGFTNRYNTDSNTISISSGGASCGFVNFSSENFWSSGDCYTLHEVDSCMIPKYLYFYLKLNERKIMSLRVGSIIPHVYKKDLEKLILYYPKLSEQKIAVSILDTLDRQIDLLRQLLDRYSKHQIGLLQFLMQET